MNIEAVLRKPRLLRALTSLDAGEFTRLLAAFEGVAQAARAECNRFGERRQRAPGATGNPGVLATPAQRLFFVLFYFECYPLQEVMGVLFGLSYEPPGGCSTLQPKRKPRGRELHPLQKTINQIIARVRVGVEHAIAEVKRCRIVADTFRNLRKGFVDEAMEVACGLHNLRVAART